MSALKKMMSGKDSRNAMIKAETDAANKRKELEGLDEESEADRAKRKMRASAEARGGRGATRLSSDTILGGAAPLG
jgi:F0F1-type ATP synthase membrane subunit b/b'